MKYLHVRKIAASHSKEEINTGKMDISFIHPSELVNTDASIVVIPITIYWAATML